MERRHLSFSSSVELTPRQLQHTISAVRIRISTHELPSRYRCTSGLTFSYSYAHPYVRLRLVSHRPSQVSPRVACGAARRGGEGRRERELSLELVAVALLKGERGFGLSHIGSGPQGATAAALVTCSFTPTLTTHLLVR